MMTSVDDEDFDNDDDCDDDGDYDSDTTAKDPNTANTIFWTSKKMKNGARSVLQPRPAGPKTGAKTISGLCIK